MVGLREEFVDHTDSRTDHFDARMPVERPKHNYERGPLNELDARKESYMGYADLNAAHPHITLHGPSIYTTWLMMQPTLGAKKQQLWQICTMSM